ncbi:MAG: AAA family ATPase, partial [Polyangiaceae bacterium]
ASEFAQVPADLDELCARMLARDPSERLNGQQALILLGSRVPDTPLPTSEPPNSTTAREVKFVGREEQLATLERAFGEQAVTIVRGRSGMGKTALVRHFLTGLGERALVLSSPCYERESVPYKAFDSAIDSLSRLLMERSDVHSLLPPDAAVLARLFPVLQRVDAIARAPRPVREATDPLHLRAQAFAAMRALFMNLARERPIALFLDDFQWGDSDSTALLTELLGTSTGGRAVVFAVVSYRSEDEASPLLLDLRTRIGAPVVEVDVQALSAVESRTLAESLLGDSDRDSLLDAVVREGAGSPLFVAELAHRARAGNAAEEGVRLDDLLRERVRALEPGARRLLEITCVAAGALPLEIAQGAVDLTPLDRMAALRTLRSAHLVRTSGMRPSDEIEPYHDRIRESLVGALDGERLRETHAALASSLLRHGENDPEALFIHFRGAGDTAAAQRQAEFAAQKSVLALAFDRAAQFYRFALELEPDPLRRQPLRVALADALVLAGRGALAAESYLAALEGATGAERVTLQRSAAEQLLCSGRIDQGTQLLEEVLAGVGVRLARTPRRALMMLILLRFWIFVRGLGFERKTEAQIPSRDLMRIDTCASVALGLGLVDVIQGAAFQTRALLFAVRAGEPTRIARALAYESGFLGGQGGKSYARAKAVLNRAAALIDPDCRGDTAAVVAGSGGMVEYFSGHWANAQVRFDRAISLHDVSTPSGRWELDTAEYYAICSLVYQGKMREVAQRLPTCRRNAEQRGDLYFACNLCVGETNLTWLANDDPVGARAIVQEKMSGWSKRGFHAQHWFELQALSLIDLYEGNPEIAAARITATWPALARSMILQIQVGLGMGLYLRGLSAIGQGDVRRAARDARALHRQKMPWLEGLALILDYGVVARGGRDGSALLEAADQQLSAADMASFAAAARFRLARLRGDEELLRSANAYFAREGIQSPDRWARMLIPQ